MNALIEVDATQFHSAPQAVHHAVTVARVTADLSGAESDTLAALMLALIEGGCACFTLTIDGEG